VKRVRDAVVEATVDRSALWAVGKPHRRFRAELLREAHERESARRDAFLGTDESMLVRAPRPPGGRRSGPARQREDHDPRRLDPREADTSMTFRSGFGFDMHPLVAGRHLVCSGVSPSRRNSASAGTPTPTSCPMRSARRCWGLWRSATSADDFPDTDPRYRGISSLTLLREVMALVTARGGTLVNVDATWWRRRPGLPRCSGNGQAVGGYLGIPLDATSVKAKSPEGLGLLGRKEGMAAMAVVSVEVA
jgi:2-C-methyl-D-erythritol 4-phosphate cytidylyltransferase/2-C-methyl-D-erythritol 2,4-cyclodiphosphate synthase